jgi:hypothetical protein
MLCPVVCGQASLGHSMLCPYTAAVPLHGGGSHRRFSRGGAGERTMMEIEP